MTALRERMITAMRVRGFAASTRQCYLAAVTRYARHFGRSPEQLSLDDLKSYIEHLVVDRGLSASTCNQALHGIGFLYREVLGQPWRAPDIAHPKRPQRIPELLNSAELARLFGVCRNPKHRLLLQCCYALGLRVSEAVHLRVRDIDGERRLVRIEQGKGRKDRLVPLPPTLHQALRTYWRREQPTHWLFPGKPASEPLTRGAASRIYHQCKQRAGIDKQGGIHALRHAYATAQLAAGLPVQQLQHQLGHADIHTTLRYVHWLPLRHGHHASADLLGELDRSARAQAVRHG